MRRVVVYDDVIREKDWEKFKFIYIYMDIEDLIVCEILGRKCLVELWFVIYNCFYKWL